MQILAGFCHDFMVVSHSFMPHPTHIKLLSANKLRDAKCTLTVHHIMAMKQSKPVASEEALRELVNQARAKRLISLPVNSQSNH